MMANFIHAVGALRRRGVHFVWTYARESLAFDLRNRTRTAPRVSKERQSFVTDDEVAADGLLYVASFTSTIRESIVQVSDILGDDFGSYQFVDLGCGRAKSLIVYRQGAGESAEHPAVGIEYDPELAESGRDNLRKVGISAADATVVTDSAERLADHVQSDRLIVYLFNSFQGDTLRRTLDALSRFDHYLVYVDPEEASLLSERGYRIHTEVTGRYPAANWIVASRTDSS